MHLTDDEKKNLLNVARMSIGSVLGECEKPGKPAGGAALEEPCGAFVTLHLHGDLRGCIGYIEARLPLWQTVGEVAEKAAFDDPRFAPLTSDEFAHINIEISVLSPLHDVHDVNEIKVGTHGLIIDAGYTRGLLLPQVATEYGWGREEFLAHTSRKAGLKADAWKGKNVTIYSFTSDVFAERHPAVSAH